MLGEVLPARNDPWLNAGPRALIAFTASLNSCREVMGGERGVVVHQNDATWLLDPLLLDARFRWHQGSLNISRTSDPIGDLEIYEDRDVQEI